MQCVLYATGTGMSEAELQRNPVLTDFTVRDLNQNPKLPYDDNSFDVITNVVSVDYLNKPLVSLHLYWHHECIMPSECAHDNMLMHRPLGNYLLTSSDYKACLTNEDCRYHVHTGLGFTTDAYSAGRKRSWTELLGCCLLAGS